MGISLNSRLCNLLIIHTAVSALMGKNTCVVLFGLAKRCNMYVMHFINCYQAFCTVNCKSSSKSNN